MADSPMLDYIIMGFLSFGAKTGYDIKHEMSQSTAYFSNASYGSIYPILKKLSKQGMAKVEERVENGKFKKVYSLTDSGKSALIKWLLKPAQIDLSEILVRIFFYRLLPVEQIEPLIGQYIEGLNKVRGELELMDREWNEPNPVARGSLQFGLDFFEFQARWFKDYLRRISDRK